jgi:hypothetical protein
MSISSVAEESALRLTRPAAAKPSIADVVAAAAAHATAAVSSGASPGEAAQQGRVAGQGAQARDAEATTPASPLAQLIKYIPTETIAIYIAVQGALGDVSIPTGGKVSSADFTSRWVWFWIMLGLTVLLTGGLSYRAQKNTNPAARFKLPIFDVLASGAAFAVWALSLPGTPLRDIKGYDYNAWNSVLILFGTVAIATTAHVLGKTVTWSKVVETGQPAA